MGQAAHTEGIVWKYPRAGRLEASILSCHWVTVTKPFSTPTPQTCFIVFEMQKAAYMDTVFGATFLKQEDSLLQK